MRDLLHGATTGKASAEKLLQEEFDIVVMSQDKSLHTGAPQELREAVARCNHA